MPDISEQLKGCANFLLNKQQIAGIVTELVLTSFCFSVLKSSVGKQ